MRKTNGLLLRPTALDRAARSIKIRRVARRARLGLLRSSRIPLVTTAEAEKLFKGFSHSSSLFRVYTVMKSGIISAI